MNMPVLKKDICWL